MKFMAITMQATNLYTSPRLAPRGGATVTIIVAPRGGATVTIIDAHTG